MTEAVSRDLYSKLASTFKGGAVRGNDEEVADVEGDRTGSTTTSSSSSSNNVLFIGDQEAGRTSLISVVVNPNKDDKPKPTVALEYLFARRSTTSSTNNASKEVAHIWDLGGGLKMNDLIRVPVKADTVATFSFVIVLDLSKPNNILPCLLSWLRVIRVLVTDRIQDMRKNDPNIADRLIAMAKGRYGKDHPDRRVVNPIPATVLIVGNKYDVFKDMDGVKRKLVAQALRFVAHFNGAGLVFTSVKEKTLRDQFRSMANNLLFRTSVKRVVETNGEKAVAIPAGGDSFDAILKAGVPNVDVQDLVSPGGNNISDKAMDIWKGHLEKFFGPSTAEDGGSREDAELHPEAQVDEARSQKDEVLHRYRKEAERKSKLAAQERRHALEDTTTTTTSSTSSSSQAKPTTTRSKEATAPAPSKPSSRRPSLEKGGSTRSLIVDPPSSSSPSSAPAEPRPVLREKKSSK